VFLFSFGDSFHFGSDLSDCDNLHFTGSRCTWPALIAKKLSTDYSTMALPGIGNQQIADSVLKCIHINKNKVFYFINWSWIDRFDTVVTNDTDQAQILDQWDYKSNSKEVWKTLLPGDTSKRNTEYYKHYHSQYTDVVRNLQIIHSTIQTLLEFECKFIITYMDNLLFEQTDITTGSVRILQNQVWPFMSSFDGKTFLEWSKDQNFAISDNWHPLEQAHEKAAEYWLPKVRILLNSNAKEDYLHAFI